MSSSLATLSSSRPSSSKITKTYRQASTLFLTRRLPEALSTLLPILETPLPDEDRTINGREDVAPISTASKTTRIKVWSLYLTLLNAIVELGPEEGKQGFGMEQWKAIDAKVRDGTIWEEVLQHGYRGREGDVDADVVINLCVDEMSDQELANMCRATLLLAHASSQLVNQQRIESYLAASASPEVDMHNGSPVDIQATPTPRDIFARVKILELYTLHVLLRNDEWDYAREFLSMSDVLDDERREAFLEALQSLREDMERGERFKVVQARNAEDVKRQWTAGSARPSRAIRDSNEEYHTVDPSPISEDPSAVISRPSSTKASIPERRVPPRPPATMLARARTILANLHGLIGELARAWSTNPLSLVRMLMYLLGIILVLGRRDVRQRLRIMAAKLRQTIGMGVKVSYM